MKFPNLIFLLALLASGSAAQPVSLESGWQAPPNKARLRAYWWWLNGNVTSNAITHDLEEMRAKGFGGAVLLDADGSSQDDNDEALHGPDFFRPHGVHFTNTRCARLTSSAWKSA
jgi:alpha-L-rhamnosidase